MENRNDINRGAAVVVPSLQAEALCSRVVHPVGSCPLAPTMYFPWRGTL